MILIYAILTALLMAVLNRAAGSNLYHLKDKWSLSGKAVLWTLPFFFAVSYLWLGWQIALAWTLSCWFWRTPAWGYWIDLGSMPDDFNREDEEPAWYEAIINRISFNNDYLALFWRHMFVLPGLLLVSYVNADWFYVLLSPLIAVAFLGCYALAKKTLYPKYNYIWLAELLCGVIWGNLILLNYGGL